MTVRHIPANGTQAAAQSVAALLVQAALRFYHVQRAGQGGDGGFLHRQEHAKVDLGAQLFAGGDHIRTAHQKADARASHVEALAQGEELHRALLGSRRIENAAAVGAVKDDVAVSVVMHQQNIVLTAEINQLSVQLRRADAAYRVGRQADQHKLCLAGHFLGDGGHIGQEVVFFC